MLLCPATNKKSLLDWIRNFPESIRFHFVISYCIIAVQKIIQTPL